MAKFRIIVVGFAISMFFIACKNSSDERKPSSNYKEIGSIEILDEEANSIIDSNAYIELLDSGFVWTEGPVWVDKLSALLFSDVPKNRVYKWEEGKKSIVYLEPSGFIGSGQLSKEPGSNGLIINKENKLVLAQHGDRQIAYMDADLNNPSPDFVSLVNNYDGKLLNSPNDLIQDSKGNYFFSDPPYGLNKAEDKQLAFNGVYKLSVDGKLTLLLDNITGPNGLALTNDEKYLLIANSEQDKAYLYECELNATADAVVNIRVAYDFTPLVRGEGDVPDGFKIDKKGNIYISGPQGLWILNKKYKPIAHLKLNDPVSNCWMADSDKVLYITNSDKILRLKLKK